MSKRRVAQLDPGDIDGTKRLARARVKRMNALHATHAYILARRKFRRRLDHMVSDGMQPHLAVTMLVRELRR